MRRQDACGLSPGAIARVMRDLSQWGFYESRMCDYVVREVRA